jgi:glycosyltransferase-like protein
MLTPLRIGLLMHSLNPRGGVVHTLELADALCARGHDVTVFAPAPMGQTLFRATRARLSVAPVQGRAQGIVAQVGALMTATADHLAALPDLADFNVLHSQDSITANALATLRDGGLIDGFVRTVHHLDHFDDLQLSAWQTRGVRAASQVLCVSALWQGVLQRDWGVATTRVSNGVNLARFHATQAGDPAPHDDALALAPLGVQASGPVWLAVGGVEERKNTLRLLHAFALARRLVPQAQLVIAGGASLLDHGAYAQTFRETLSDLGMAPGQPHAHAVRVTGPVPDVALPALYRRAAALAMPSLREGFGLVVLEALACGTPAIASRMAPFTEHLAEHEALWADPLDVHSIAQALLRSLDAACTQPVLMAAPALCQRMSWSRSAQGHEAIYQSHLTPHEAAHA